MNMGVHTSKQLVSQIPWQILDDLGVRH
jgi:hypothetical protein